MTTDPIASANRLIHEKSPYLLQHAYNPVEWFPWGTEAFEKAEQEGKPIFLSIGYSTCHWCHVMEHESFEDEDVAALLNASFVCIKVDREERPDIDHIYMTVCQALTGQGGWPLTVILTPEQTPVFAGTYFPKQSRYGRPGLMDILAKVAEEWSLKSESLVKYGRNLMAKLNAQLDSDGTGEWNPSSLQDAYRSLRENFDDAYGGFGRAPKFPTPHNLMFLLRYGIAHDDSGPIAMVRQTLDGMAAGGLHDHVGGGFARYSTDEFWLVPHFEKMLYDNALLAMAYTEAYQVTQDEKYRNVVEGIFSYIARDMTHPEGAFYSAEDADSEGEEGLFYLWTPEQIHSVLGEKDGPAYCAVFGVTENGNFEGRNIPNRIGHFRDDVGDANAWANWNGALLKARSKRIRPHLDDKILTSWNGLMIAALAKASRVFGNTDWLERAKRATTFIQTHLLDEQGRLLARYRDGEARYLGYVDDYAYLVWAMLELYESTLEPEYLSLAIGWQRDMLTRFWDGARGGFFFYPHDAESLVARPKEIYDGATPSGNSVAALNLLRLARTTGDPSLEARAEEQLRAFAKTIESYPAGHTFYLMAMQFAAGPTREIVIVGQRDEESTEIAIRKLQGRFGPNTILMLITPDSDGQRIREMCPAVASFGRMDGKSTYYLCENFACRRPTIDFGDFLSMLE